VTIESALRAPRRRKAQNSLALWRFGLVVNAQFVKSVGCT